MKRFIKSGTNTSNIPAKPEIIEAAEGDDEASATFDDKINDAKDDFDYILDGLGQLDMVQGNDILNRIHESLQGFIQEIASELS